MQGTFLVIHMGRYGKSHANTCRTGGQKIPTITHTNQTPTCDVEDREKSESKSTHFEHLLLLAALLNLSQALPVLSLEDSIIPSIEGSTLEPLQLLIQQVLSRVLSRVKEEANLSCSSIISILDQLLHREVIVVCK